MLRAVSRLDRGRLPVELIGVEAGDEIELSRELVVTASATKHTIPSLGYIVWQRRQKLKPEFQQLTGDQIRDLRNSGNEVTQEQRNPILAYLGDSAPEGLDNCPDMYRAKILIAEMTFVAPEHRKDKIHKHGHMHIDDYVARKDRFENECIITGHFSTRYHDQQIRNFVKKELPDMLDGRLHLWL
jgi:ribonuclease Z